MAIAGYQFIDRGKLGSLSPSASGNLDGVFQGWIMTLSLIYGGDALRSRAYAELRHRRSQSFANLREENLPSAIRCNGGSHPVADGAAGLVTIVLNLAVSPILLFWAVICSVGNLAWLRSNLPPVGFRVQIWQIPWLVGYHNFQSLCLWWLLAVILFVTAVGMLWIGFRSLFWRSPPSE
jgi:hypothetical protein